MNDAHLTKIRAILTKAEDPACTAPEAEAFFALAAQLMAKYGLDEAMLAAAKPENKGKPEQLRMECAAPYAMEKVTLVNVLAEAMGMKCVLLSRAGYKGSQVMFIYGFRGDLDRLEMLYTSLLLQSASAMREAEATVDRPYWEDIRAWRRSFLNGYAGGVARIVRQAEEAARVDYHRPTGSDGPSVALVVADRRDEVDAAFREAHPNVTQGGRRNLTGSGRRDGYRAGQRANLGGRSVAGGRTALGR